MGGADTCRCNPLASDAYLIFQGEQDINVGVRAALYLLLLFWFFMGVAIVADVFMGAIEKITSTSKRRWCADQGKYVTYVVWNDTVANLTLMALGSSAPEILLGCIEIMLNDFHAGDLGPSTIVGSAAFNLFVIIAVCVIAIPNGEVRSIKDINVYVITATFSLVAYVWLYVIISVISVDVVDIWEGLVTLLLFPLLVVLAFLADVGVLKFSFAKEEASHSSRANSLETISAEHIARLQLLNTLNAEKKDSMIDDKALVSMIQARASHAGVSRAHYRVGAIRQMTGAGKKVPQLRTCEEVNRKLTRVVPVHCDCDSPPSDAITDAITIQPKVHVCIEFRATRFVVMENVGSVMIDVTLEEVTSEIERTDTVKVDYRTRDGSAVAGSDYTALDATLEFPPEVNTQTIEVRILDDDDCEDDEDFFLDLYNPSSGSDICNVTLGVNKTATILIVDDDEQGSFSFEKQRVEVQEEAQESILEVTVVRTGGCAGTVSCDYATEDGSARAGVDYAEASGTLTFNSGQASAHFPVKIKSKGRYKVNDEFQVILSNPTGGATLPGGFAQSDPMFVVITPNPNHNERAEKIADLLRSYASNAQLGSHSWSEQLRQAIAVGSSNDDDDDEDCESPGAMAYLLHAITVFWKVLFATIPPADFCNGWLCFYVSLVMIGLVTACIAEISGLVGCCMGMPDAITAITLVALGTSLPDTFASKTAAVQDPHADASVGNVTGSNSVNVFLGIGLSFTIGAVYWAIVGDSDPEWARRYPDIAQKYPNGGKLVVIGGDLGFSVGIYCGFALVAVGVLALRRLKFGGELGGDGPMKWGTAIFLTVLWLLYIALSSWKTMKTLSESCGN